MALTTFLSEIHHLEYFLLSAGNHEYYTGDVDNWIAELPKLGVTPLINSRVCLLGREGEGGECVGGIYLAGLEDITTRNWGM